MKLLTSKNTLFKIVVLAGFGGSLFAADSTTPIVANMTVKEYRVTSGGDTLIRNETGTFARAADGSEAEWLNDTATGTPSTTRVRANGSSTTVQHKLRAYSVSPFNKGALPAEVQRQMAARDQELVNGVWTQSGVVKDGNTGQPIGKTWRSAELGLVVRQEMEVTLPNARLRIVRELSNVQAGTVPDPKLFEAPIEGKSLLPSAR